VRRVGVTVVLALILAAFGPRLAAPTARAATVAFTRGYQLVSGPDGTVFSGVFGQMYTLDVASQQFRPFDPTQPVRGGVGYFAYLAAPVALVKMGADSHDPVSVNVPAGGYALVGNPSAYSGATVAGADAVYGFDASAGYMPESQIPPGQGALVYSDNGGTVTISPVPAGVDKVISQADDLLIAQAISAADLGGSYTLISAEIGGDVAVLPAGYAELLLRTPLPTSSDADGSVLAICHADIAVNDYVADAALTSVDAIALQQSLGSDDAQVTETDPPQGLGDAARLFTLRETLNGTPLDGAILSFRQGRYVAWLGLIALPGKLDQSKLLGLAHILDGRFLATPLP
jgi:hypothetical protein